MSSKLRVIGYGRESTKEQARYGFNLDDQEKKIRSYVDIYYETGTYELTMIREEGASAKSLDRPRMNEIITMVKRKQVDVIVVHNLDRLTRRVKDLATLLEMFDLYGVHLLSITEKIDTETPMGRFFIFLIVLIAQWEQDTISDRTRRGIEESARQGNYALPGAPFGYRRNPDDNHKLIICEEEATVVREIFECIAYKDYKIKEMQNKLNSNKVLGKHWSKETIERIVDNKIYYGTFTRFDREYENHTMPIINKELYETAHARLKGIKIRQKKEYIYNGLIVCEECGRILANHSSKSGNGRIHNYYICTSCKKQISENDLNKEYSNVFTSMLRNERYFADLKKVKEKYDDLEEILDTIPVSAFMYSADINYLMDIYGRKMQDSSRLEYCLKTLSAGVRYTSFLDLPYSDKREFLQNHILKIVFEPKTKIVTVHYLDDKTNTSNEKNEGSLSLSNV